MVERMFLEQNIFNKIIRKVINLLNTIKEKLIMMSIQGQSWLSSKEWSIWDNI